MNIKIKEKKCLLVHSKNIFIDDILSLLKNSNFVTNVVDSCNAELFKIKNQIRSNNLCLIVATFDNYLLYNDMGRICTSPGMSLDVVFMMGLIAGVINPPSVSTKILVYNRDRIISPDIICTIPQVSSLIALKNFLQEKYCLPLVN